MEIKLNAGDKINIPENCKATIKDNLIVIEEKQEEFKDGDILHSKVSNITVIFKYFTTKEKGIFRNHDYGYKTPELGLDIGYFRHATEKEKQAFFEELKAKGLRWNAETKTMERIRKRAKLNDFYLYIGRNGEVLEVMDYKIPYDDDNYNVGNYYLPHERGQAEKDAKAIRAIFEKRLKVK